MPLQILSEGVNVQLGDIRSRLTDIGGDVKQLRRDVDRQSVVVSMFTFTARTALVVILTFALTMFLEFGKEKAKRLRARS